MIDLRHYGERTTTDLLEAHDGESNGEADGDDSDHTHQRDENCNTSIKKSFKQSISAVQNLATSLPMQV